MFDENQQQPLLEDNLDSQQMGQSEDPLPVPGDFQPIAVEAIPEPNLFARPADTWISEKLSGWRGS